jgi:hypothetical protein
VNTTCSIDELNRDAHMIADPAHCAFDGLGNAELAPNLGNIDRLGAESE